MSGHIFLIRDVFLLVRPRVLEGVMTERLQTPRADGRALCRSNPRADNEAYFDKAGKFPILICAFVACSEAVQAGHSGKQ